jgi:VanZ family protein
MKVTVFFFEYGQRVAAWCCLGAIGILSLLPAAEVAPMRTGLGGHIEHLLAYAATTLFTAFAYVDHSRFKIGLALTLYVATLEFLQRYAPGRLSSLNDLAFSATGIMLGIATFHVIQHVRARHASNRARFANGDMRSSS